MTDHAPLLERAFEIEAEEASYRIDDILGEIPSYVRGRYVLNGPATFQRGSVRYDHWLDGDGMVVALDFSADGVRITHRFVRGKKRTEEEAAGRALYRTFGTRFVGDALLRGRTLASPLNVSVYPFAGRLLAFGEQGLPWELDPETLETRGEHTFGGRLNEISPFAAHPAFDPATGEMLNFGISFSATRPLIHLYRFDRGGALLSRRRIALEHPASIHDFALTSRFVVFYVNPYVLDIQAIEAGATLLEALTWKPELGAHLLVVDRASGRELARVAIEPAYCLHWINSFETGKQLVLDVVELERPVYDQYGVPELFPDVRHARPVRYVVDLSTFSLAARNAFDDRRMCDFPTVDPRRWHRSYESFWTLAISATEEKGRKFFDQLVRSDWELGRPAALYQAPPLHYLGGEPVFVPDPGDPSGGAVICQIFDAATRTSSFLIFDAFDLAAGPSVTLRLRRPIPLGFHASYEPHLGTPPVPSP